MAEVAGTCEPRFNEVRDLFAANFTEHGDVGAGLCVYLDGHPVVDLLGGSFDVAQTRPYDNDTLQMVFSTTKGATAIAAHLLVQRGELDLDAPVSRYWPEFAANGKEDIPVRWLLSHKAGLPDVDRAMSLDDALDWDKVAEALAASAPIWEPGSQHGYHAVTYGFLVGELVRRVSGRSLGTFFAEEVAGPLGLDFWIGLPEDQVHRVSPLIPFTAPAAFLEMGLTPDGGGEDGKPASLSLVKALDRFFGPGNLVGRALAAPGGAFADQEDWNLPKVLAAEIPAANGVTNARSLARMYAACVGEVDGVRLLDEATVHTAMRRETEGGDAVLVIEIPFGSGFMLHSMFSKLGSPSCFGHYGAGGSVGFADIERNLSFGWVMNQTDLALTGDPRTARLIDAVYAAL